jgi:hypothetical protein
MASDAVKATVELGYLEGVTVAIHVRVGARLFPIAFPILPGARAAGALATP